LNVTHVPFKGFEKLIWAEGSPHLDVGFLSDGGAVFHERAHTVNAKKAYEKSRDDLKTILNICVNKIGIQLGGQMVVNRQERYKSYKNYLDVTMHAGTNPDWGHDWEYLEGLPADKGASMLQQYTQKDKDFEIARRSFMLLRK
jgi:hypothetical protein